MQDQHQSDDQRVSVQLTTYLLKLKHLLCLENMHSWLVKHPGFEFDLLARDPTCLPKEYKNAEGTCFFLNGYAHEGVDPDASLNEHIDAAMAAITASN